MINNSFRLMSLALTLTVLTASPAWAIDIITRKSQSTRLSGEITGVSKSGVTIKQQTGGEVEVPANDIALIEWDAAPATLKAALGQESNGAYNEAIDALKNILEGLPATATNIRTDAEYFIARNLAKAALADSSRLPDAIARMKSFTDANITSYHYYEAMDFLGRLHLAAGNYPQAEAAFTSVENSGFEDWKISAQSSKARVMLAQNQVDQALAAFDAVLATPAKDDASKQRQLEAKLGKAKCLNLKNQYDNALTLLESIVKEAAEDDARLQAEACALSGTALLGQGKNLEAALAYLKIDVLFPGQQDFHAEALYNLAQLWPSLGQPGRAEEARAQLEAKYPNSPWTKKLSGV